MLQVVLGRVLLHDEDTVDVRRLAAVALLRLGQHASPAVAMLQEASAQLKACIASTSAANNSTGAGLSTGNTKGPSTTDGTVEADAATGTGTGTPKGNKGNPKGKVKGKSSRPVHHTLT